MDVNVSTEEVLAIIKDSLREKRPFLLSRFGEGESRIFERNDDGAGGTKWIIKNLIGTVPDNIDDIVDEMELALVNSDITGLPGNVESTFMTSFSGKDSHDLYKNIYGHFRRIFKKKGINQDQVKYCQVNIHGKFDFESLLTDMDEVIILTCRDVCEKIKSYFNIKSVKWYQIPPEYKYELDKSKPWNFYPEVHHRIRDEFLAQNNRGKLLLFGAGALGKDLGYYFKKSGGVAFDIGSVFDHWYGKRTRGPGKGRNIYGESPLDKKNVDAK